MSSENPHERARVLRIEPTTILMWGESYSNCTNVSRLIQIQMTWKQKQTRNPERVRMMSEMTRGLLPPDTASNCWAVIVQCWHEKPTGNPPPNKTPVILECWHWFGAGCLSPGQHQRSLECMWHSEECWRLTVGQSQNWKLEAVRWRRAAGNQRN